MAALAARKAAPRAGQGEARAVQGSARSARAAVNAMADEAADDTGSGLEFMSKRGGSRITGEVGAPESLKEPSTAALALFPALAYVVGETQVHPPL